MAKTLKSTATYAHPFSKAYWCDAAAELKDVRTLVITALMIALRVALKPLAIPLGPQMSIQTAMLATALGAMIFGPVVAIPAAMISDTIGFMIFPTGDYFLPFMLTEIASTMFYALCLYRAKPSPMRVMLSRLFICFLVNVVLQQLIFSWQYTYMGNPDKAKDAIMGITTISRLFKNLFFFPVESVVLTLFLKALMPVTTRMGLTYGNAEDMKFSKGVIIAMICLVLVGGVTSVGYLNYYYDNNSITKDYSAEEVVDTNKAVHNIICQQDASVVKDKTVAVVEYAHKPFLGKETTYTVALYEVVEGVEVQDYMWSLKKTPASKDKNLNKLGTATIVVENKTGEIVSFDLQYKEK